MQYFFPNISKTVEADSLEEAKELLNPKTTKNV